VPAILARKGVLRVAPGSSAPLGPLFAAQAATVRCVILAPPGRDGIAGSPIELEGGFGATAP
jgi:hypothetical protein